MELVTDDESPFTYIENTGKGPKRWGQIDPHWHVCDKGKLQSPIDLHDERVQVFPDLGKLKRDYKPAPAVVKNRGHDVTVSQMVYLFLIFEYQMHLSTYIFFYLAGSNVSITSKLFGASTLLREKN